MRAQGISAETEERLRPFLEDREVRTLSFLVTLAVDMPPRGTPMLPPSSHVPLLP